MYRPRSRRTARADGPQGEWNERKNDDPGVVRGGAVAAASSRLFVVNVRAYNRTLTCAVFRGFRRKALVRLTPYCPTTRPNRFLGRIARLEPRAIAVECSVVGLRSTDGRCASALADPRGSLRRLDQPSAALQMRLRLSAARIRFIACSRRSAVLLSLASSLWTSATGNLARVYFAPRPALCSAKRASMSVATPV